MSVVIRVDGLDADGVSLLSPARPEFDELARPLLGERIADLALRLKPLLVIVSNESAQTIVSLSIVWHVRYHGGRTGRMWSHTSFPEVVCGDVLISHNPEALPAGQRRIEANGLVIHRWGYLDEYFDQFLGHFVHEKDALLADAVDLRIELNGVIFADGTLVGADDQSALSDLFSTYVRAKQDWYRGIIEAIGAGQTVAEAFGPVERFSAGVTQRIRARKHSFREEADFWAIQAAGDANRWRRRYTDAEIHSLLQQSIRLEPFVIRRGR
jgi:hypothetical protein